MLVGIGFSIQSLVLIYLVFLFEIVPPVSVVGSWLAWGGLLLGSLKAMHVLLPDGEEVNPGLRSAVHWMLAPFMLVFLGNHLLMFADLVGVLPNVGGQMSWIILSTWWSIIGVSLTFIAMVLSPVERRGGRVRIPGLTERCRRANDPMHVEVREREAVYLQRNSPML